MSSSPLIQLTEAHSHGRGTQNLATRVTIAPARGAIVTSMQVAARELLYLDQSTFTDATKNVRGGIPVLFPSPGKLDNDRFSRDGHEGVMKQHGFARTLPWSVVQQTAETALLSLTSDTTTLAQYPWPFAAELHFALANACLRITTRIHNTGRQPMPYALGFHPYFQVDDKTHAHIDSKATRAFDNVTHRQLPFTGFDLTAGEVDLHLLDHPDGAMTLQLDRCTRIEVRASQDFAHWVVWTLAGKPFVCVEPWTSPGNALNTAQRLITLAPDETRESWMEIALIKTAGEAAIER